LAIETSGSRGNEGYAKFRAALLGGQLQPGATITQAEMCDALGMSISPLRDTLALLESDGLVSVRHRAGITILTPDVGFIRTNFQFRSLIEREAIARFTEGVSADWLDKTRARHETALKHVRDYAASHAIEAELRAIDWDFHTAIVAALRNEMIAETHFRIQENLRLARVLNQDYASPSKVAEALNEHAAILEASAARDAALAEQALEAHFRAAIHRAFGG